jgi:hypothetical protein
MKRFCVQRAPMADTRWLCAVLDREGTRFGTRARLMADGRIELERVAAAGIASHGG